MTQLLLLAFAATSSAAEPKEGDSDLTDAKSARTAFAAQDAKLKTALAGDPRVKKTVKQAQDISKFNLWGLDDYENDMQEGEDGTWVSFPLPPGAGKTLDLTPIVGGKVDADLQGFANLDLDLTVRSLKVTFMK